VRDLKTRFQSLSGQDLDFPALDMQEFIKRHREGLLGSWGEISKMLSLATSSVQRRKMPDSYDRGWIFNWFCMDHVGYVDNPRHRAMGIHQIFDYYQDMVKAQGVGDGLHWHFHPMSTYREAHRNATSYINSPLLWEIIGRRILDRNWFPRANRAGFHTERADSHWFLEQWIPFDLSNASSLDLDPVVNKDISDGRLLDWRWAPDDWRTYHPSHDCYQLEGNCRRKISRCLMVLNRCLNINETEMQKAFQRANSGKPTLVGIASHDWRDLSVEMDYIQFLISRVAPRFPDVKFKYSEAVEAFNLVHPPIAEDALVLNCRLILNSSGLPWRVIVKTKRGSVFGPQPFLAVRTRSRRVIHDNFNYGKSLQDFSYTFDENSILPDDVKAIGVAANDDAGNQSIHTVDLDELTETPENEVCF
jgi:hypothetical protein